MLSLRSLSFSSTAPAALVPDIPSLASLLLVVLLQMISSPFFPSPAFLSLLYLMLPSQDFQLFWGLTILNMSR